MQKDDLYAKQRKLIEEFKSTGDVRIAFLLLKNYQGLLVKIANSMQWRFRNSPLTYEDYYQFLSYDFIERTRKYDLNSRMKYSSYIQTFLTLDVTNYAKKYLTQSHKLMNFSSSQINEENLFILEDDLIVTFDDLNYDSLTKKQKALFLKLIENGGSVKKTSKKLKIPEKTIYRHRKEIVKKLNKNNGVD